MIKILIFILFFFSLTTANVLAHVSGLPTAIINGEALKEYSPQKVHPNFFSIPLNTDLAPRQYLVNETITLAIDAEKLEIPQEISQKTNVLWDFGDGTPILTIKNGYTNSHKYSRPGTYIMTVRADYAAAGFTEVGMQQIQSTVITILPSKNYQIPLVTIMVNGQKTTSSQTLSLDLNKEVTLEGYVNKSSGKIVSYEWSFDDGKESSGRKITHRYKLPQYFAAPVLRVTDENGIFVDTYVQITNSGKNEPTDPDADILKIMVLIVGGSIFVTGVLGTASFLAIKYLRR